MAARWGRLRGVALRTGAQELVAEEEGEAAARLQQARRAKAARLRRVQRLLEPPGPPERTLCRAAMEQMRYLRRESPEEWPAWRLARGFGVSAEVVVRVLRSGFSPSPERAAQQDGRVQARRSGGGFSGLPAPAGQTPPLAICAGTETPVAAPRKRPGQPQKPQERRVAQPAQQAPEPPLRVVQKGRDFLDGDGNFLYRLPV